MSYEQAVHMKNPAGSFVIFLLSASFLYVVGFHQETNYKL